jgi:hypothetical protein
MLSVGLWRWYVNITDTILDIIHCPVFYLHLNSIGLSVCQRKYIKSTPRAQQVNAIYRFVTMVYYYNCHNSGHIYRPVFYLKHNVLEIGFYLRLQVAAGPSS